MRVIFREASSNPADYHIDGMTTTILHFNGVFQCGWRYPSPEWLSSTEKSATEFEGAVVSSGVPSQDVMSVAAAFLARAIEDEKSMVTLVPAVNWLLTKATQWNDIASRRPEVTLIDITLNGERLSIGTQMHAVVRGHA